jgi:non-ribosomal peptide synthetase component F
MNSTLTPLWVPKFASQPALFIPDGPEVTSGQLQDQVEAVTTTQREGASRPGSRLALCYPNNLEYLVAFLATTGVRAIAAPLHPVYKVEAFRFYLGDAGARAIMVAPGDLPAREATRQLQILIWECGLGPGSRRRFRLSTGFVLEKGGGRSGGRRRRGRNGPHSRPAREKPRV